MFLMVYSAITDHFLEYQLLVFAMQIRCFLSGKNGVGKYPIIITIIIIIIIYTNFKPGRDDQHKVQYTALPQNVM
jgi:hypothetical protein